MKIEPIDESIIKWERILNGEITIDTLECPLCKTYECEECPLEIYFGGCSFGAIEMLTNLIQAREYMYEVNKE